VFRRSILPVSPTVSKRYHPDPLEVGTLSRLLVELEANPYEPTLTSASPYLKYLTCLAEHAPDVPKAFKRDVASPKRWGGLARRLAGESAQQRAFLATTQAIDLVRGGVKVNALPEVASGTSFYPTDQDEGLSLPD
jgi:Gly-Xaa carboxypeptidase